MAERLKAYKKAARLEAGCDEAGRGCLAGPVFAAAVILPFGSSQDRPFGYTSTPLSASAQDRPFGKLNPLIRDSKQLTEAQRTEARHWIEEHALAWAVKCIDPAEIDKINILQAAIKAMHLCLEALPIRPEFILVDGHYFHPFPSAEDPIPYSCEVKGDARFLSIAAASVLAKTHRDAYMLKLHEEYPQYGWDTNKGYPTIAHRRAIMEYGPSPHHRRSFRLYPPEGEQGKLF